MSSRINNVGELKQELANISDTTPIFLGTWNGWTDTYCLADHMIVDKFEQFENDFYGTEGKMDKRLFNKDFIDKDVVFIGSLFHRNIDNKEIDDDYSDPNQDIALINGENGDHDLFWKSNGFTKIEKLDRGWYYWSLESDNWSIHYQPKTKTVEIINGDEYRFSGLCVGVYDFINATKICKINKTWRIG